MAFCIILNITNSKTTLTTVGGGGGKEGEFDSYHLSKGTLVEYLQLKLNF